MLTTLTGTRNSILKLEADSKDFIQRDAFLESILDRPTYKINKFTDSVDLNLLKDKKYGKKKALFFTPRLIFLMFLPFVLLESSGFKIIEENITLERKGGKTKTNTKEPFRDRQQYEIRWAQDKDRNFVEDIAKKISPTTGFIKTRKLTIHWPMKSRGNGLGNFFLGKRGDAMIVATANNRPVAFCSYFSKKKHSVIDLIAVSKKHRKKGLSKQMIIYALQNLSDRNRWLVGTQSTNIPSVRLYESLGFQNIGSQHVLHKHSI